jgi:hypothetical protein
MKPEIKTIKEHLENIFPDGFSISHLNISEIDAEKIDIVMNKKVISCEDEVKELKEILKKIDLVVKSSISIDNKCRLLHIIINNHIKHLEGKKE